MDPLLQDLISEAVRTVFIVCVPCIAAVAGLGLLGSIFQTATSIHEQAFSYAIKLVAFFAVTSLFIGRMREALVALCTHALQG